MKKQRILLTGDDGFDSLGTRILIHLLKDTYDLSIAGTKTQQSGVGGYKHVKEKGAWGEEVVDGVRALWLDGSPVDAVEAARLYFRCPFDYVVSGINWGVNIGGCLITSGTFSAAFHSVNLGVAKRAIAISWDLPSENHFVRHTKEASIDAFIKHPGESAYTALTRTFKNNLWGASIVNINIPERHTESIEFATPLSSVHGFWPSMVLDKKSGMFSYKWGDHTMTMGEKRTEVQVVRRGHIAITPCQATMLDPIVYKKVMNRKSG